MKQTRNFRAFIKATRRFGNDTGGSVALLFGLSAVMLFTAMGAGLDLSRAYLARQKLSQVATLACQYATREGIAKTATASYGGTNGGPTYEANVNNFIATTWQSQNVVFAQTTATPFTYTRDVNSKISPDVQLSAVVPTTFMNIIGVTEMPVRAHTTCSFVQRVPDSQGQFVLKESFEASGTPGAYTFYKPNGSVGTQAASTSYTTATGYTGADGAKWSIVGYCLEQDSAGVIKSNVADGNFSVELDCDNGNGSRGNSSISTRVSLAAGVYELRYNYVSRVDYPNYNPTYLCGSAASDLAWANDSNSQGGPVANVARTNQMNVYLDINPSSNAPPTHTTIDATQQLSGSNLIDMCVYSSDWIERSVSINVTTPGDYWVSFAADGMNDSYGGQLDNIRLCRVTCPGAVEENFPTAWNGNKVLFGETFELPVYVKDPGISENRAKGGNLALTFGTSGTSSSGWPSQAASGWAVAPYNQMNVWLTTSGMTNASAGSQFMSMFGWNGFSTTTDPLYRSISRPFLLDPGYYAVSYNYVSLLDFTSSSVTGVTCTAAPAFTNDKTAGSKINGKKYGGSSTVYNEYRSTNILNVHMAYGESVSTPSVNTTLGGAPTYKNPNTTTTSASPTVPLDNGTNFATYNASAVNPVIDTCSYSGGFAWTPRSVNIRITKPGWYWLNFSALGDPVVTGTAGPGIDNIRLTALGGSSISTPSSPVVSIPVPSPQPGSNIYFTGFSISANPFGP